MAMRIDISTERYSRTTGLPATNAFTMMGWFRIAVDRNNYTCFLYHGNGTGNELELQTDVNGTTLMLWASGTTGDSVTGSSLTVGDWNHLALTFSGGNALGYLNGVLNITNPVTSLNATQTQMQFGNSPYDEFLNGRLAALKVYDAVLTQSEIAQEMMQYLPFRTANLHGWWPLLNPTDDQTDFSGNARTLTVGGSPTLEDGPPIPWSAGRRKLIIPTSGGGGGGGPVYNPFLYSHSIFNPVIIRSEKRNNKRLIFR